MNGASRFVFRYSNGPIRWLMRLGANKKRCYLPMTVVCSNAPENTAMFTIDRIPGICQSFFRPHRQSLGKRAWPHFWGLVLAIAMATEHTVERLNALLRNHTHRTNDGEFL